MDEIKNKQVFVVLDGTYLGITTFGITIIPATVHQQHGDDVHCFIRLPNKQQEMLITVKETSIHLNIKSVMDVANSILLKPQPKDQQDEVDNLSVKS